MPIYDQGYRRYVARSPLHRARFWPITREALTMILARRAFLGLMLGALLPFAFRVVEIYIVTRYPEMGRLLPAGGRLFGDFLNGQILLMVLLTVFGASGLIANDLRTGAILVYLSRPLTQRDYIVGKLGVPLALNLAVTLVPGLLLYLCALLLAPQQYLAWSLAWIPPAIVAHALAASLVLSLLTLAISSLSKSARVAGVGFVAVFFGLEVMRTVLQAGFGRNEAVLISLWGGLKALGVAFFGVEDYQLSVAWVWPLLVLTLASLACLAVLRARVRAVEIVR
jgi:ABC-type transport system involved in multi-copper enzyme maturation permease subunit